MKLRNVNDTQIYKSTHNKIWIDFILFLCEHKQKKKYFSFNCNRTAKFHSIYLILICVQWANSLFYYLQAFNQIYTLHKYVEEIIKQQKKFFFCNIIEIKPISNGTKRYGWCDYGDSANMFRHKMKEKNAIKNNNIMYVFK